MEKMMVPLNFNKNKNFSKKPKRFFCFTKSFSSFEKKSWKLFFFLYSNTEKKICDFSWSKEKEEFIVYSPSWRNKSSQFFEKRIAKNRLSPQLLLKKDGFLAMNTMLFATKWFKRIDTFKFSKTWKRKNFSKKTSSEKRKTWNETTKKKKTLFSKTIMVTNEFI